MCPQIKNPFPATSLFNRSMCRLDFSKKIVLFYYFSSRFILTVGNDIARCEGAFKSLITGVLLFLLFCSMSWVVLLGSCPAQQYYSSLLITRTPSQWHDRSEEGSSRIYIVTNIYKRSFVELLSLFCSIISKAYSDCNLFAHSANEWIWRISTDWHDGAKYHQRVWIAA